MSNNPSERLVKGSFYLLLDNLSNTLIGALFWFVVAKIIEPSAVGEAMLVMALTSSIVGFVGFGARITLSKYLSEYNAKSMYGEALRVLKFSFRLAIIICAVSSISLVFLSGTIADSFYNKPELAPLITLAAAVFLPADALYMTITGVFQGSQKMQYIFFTRLIQQVTKIISASVLILSGSPEFGIVAGFALGSSLASLTGYLYLSKIVSIIKGKHKEMLAKGVAAIEEKSSILRFSTMNYVAQGTRILSMQLGVIMLGTKSMEWSAFFGLAALIPNIIGGVINVVSLAILPTASEEYAKGKRKEFKDLFNTAVRLSLVMSGLIFLILIIDPAYILALISKEYVEASTALRILVIGAFIGTINMPMTSILNAAGKATLVAIRELIVALILIVSTIILAPIMGLEGAAIAVLISSITRFLILMVLLRGEEILPSAKSVAKPIIPISVGIITGYISMTLIHNTPLVLAIALLSYASATLGYKAITTKEIKSMISIVLQRG